MDNILEDVVWILTQTDELKNWYERFNISRYNFNRILSGGTLKTTDKRKYKFIVREAIKLSKKAQWQLRKSEERIKRAAK